MNTHDFCITNCDTDSISFRKKDNTSFSEKECVELIKEINSLLPDMIEYEDDGYFDNALIIKAKNYCLVEHNKTEVKKKGSSITDTKKEPALLEMLDKLIKDLIFNEGVDLVNIYEQYIKEVTDIADINRWANKKNVTSAVLNPTRTNEQKVLDALNGRKVQEGDKVYMFADIDGEVQKVVKGEPVFLKSGEAKMEPNRILRLVEDYQGTYDLEHYLKRVWMTTKILENVVDIDLFTKYHLKSNLKLLENL